MVCVDNLRFAVAASEPLKALIIEIAGRVATSAGEIRTTVRKVRQRWRYGGNFRAGEKAIAG